MGSEVFTNPQLHKAIHACNNELDFKVWMNLIQHREGVSVNYHVFHSDVGASITLSQWCILHIPLNFLKIYKVFPPYSLINFFFSAFYLFWPWCIYASCFTLLDARVLMGLFVNIIVYVSALIRGLVFRCFGHWSCMSRAMLHVVDLIESSCLLVSIIFPSNLGKIWSFVHCERLRRSLQETWILIH